MPWTVMLVRQMRGRGQAGVRPQNVRLLRKQTAMRQMQRDRRVLHMPALGARPAGVPQRTRGDSAFCGVRAEMVRAAMSVVPKPNTRRWCLHGRSDKPE